jgi:hypothetical protein
MNVRQKAECQILLNGTYLPLYSFAFIFLDNNLISSLPTQIGSLTNLQELYLGRHNDAFLELYIVTGPRCILHANKI